MADRAATVDEIKKYYARHIRLGWRVRYRHWMTEHAHRKSTSGVRNREYTRSKLTEDLQVTFHGRKEDVVGTYAKLESGYEMVYDLRVKGISGRLE